MPSNRTENPRKPHIVGRAIVEVSFIIFLFYANLLMGEFTASNGHGKTFAFALRDIVTKNNLCIAFASALIGFFVFEFLRKKIY